MQIAILIVAAAVVLFVVLTVIRTVRVVNQGYIGVTKRLGQFHGVHH